MSWDKPSHGDTPDENDRPGERLDKNGERPFPGEPLDRPAVSPPEGPLKSWDQVREQRKAFDTNEEYRNAYQSGYFETDEWYARSKYNRDGSEKTDQPVDSGDQDADKRSASEPDTPVTPQDKSVEASEPTDQGTRPERTDAPRSAERRIEGLEHELSETKTELARANDDRSKLVGVVADLSAENKRLREQLDKGVDHVSGSPDMVTAESRDNDTDKPDKPWYKRVPSEAKVGAATAGAGFLEAVAAVTHHMTSAEGTIATSAVGVGVAGIALAREHYKNRDGK